MSYAIFALGSNGNGQLGIGHSDDVSKPARCLFNPKSPPPKYPVRPIKIAAGGNHTLLLYSDGSVFAAGQNDDGRCGLPRTSEPITRFTRVSFPATSSESVDNVASTVKDVISNFEDIAATWSSSVFVTSKNGKQVVYTCGSGDFGELGQGPEVRSSFEPRVIAGCPAQDKKIVATSSSFRHVVMLTADGQLYGWGNGRKDQLGKLDRLGTSPKPSKMQVSWDPRQIRLIERARSAACGRDFTCVLHEASPPAILGIEAEKNDKYGISRLLTDSPASAERVTILATTWNGVYLLAKDGHCTSWGKNDRGQLVPQALRMKSLSCLKTGSEHVMAYLGDSSTDCHDELPGTDDQSTSGGSLQRFNKIVVWGWTEHGNCGTAVPGGVEEGGYNCFTLPGARYVAPLGAGCATTFMLAEGADTTSQWVEEHVIALPKG